MERRSQGSFEYLMLLAGVLLIVVLAMVMVRTGVLQKAMDIVFGNYDTLKNVTDIANCTISNCP
ncbi:MAG: class III signal peptide-containing protein [Candidatus Micrarchaeota archaeon]